MIHTVRTSECSSSVYKQTFTKKNWCVYVSHQLIQYHNIY